jgi:hypothetical protein
LEVLSNRGRVRGRPWDESEGPGINPNQGVIQGERVDPGANQRLPCHEKEGYAHQEDQGSTYLPRPGPDLEAVPECHESFPLSEEI